MTHCPPKEWCEACEVTLGKGQTNSLIQGWAPLGKLIDPPAPQGPESLCIGATTVDSVKWTWSSECSGWAGLTWGHHCHYPAGGPQLGQLWLCRSVCVALTLGHTWGVSWEEGAGPLNQGQPVGEIAVS